MSEPHLLMERDGYVATVTMNRPASKNAWSLEMMARMADTWAEIDADDGVRVAILTGAGDTFCAGADLKLMHSDRSDDPWQKRFKDDADLAWRGVLRGHQLSKPLIAAVEGFALGGGTEILQATDIRVAGRSATFGLTEPRWGLFPLGGSTVRLARQIPFAAAMEIALTGRPIGAERCLAWGLINRVVDDGEALNEARRIASKIASNGPLAVQAVKRSIIENLGMNEEDAFANELKIGWPIVFDTEDAKEGPRAFAEGRKPDFKGK